MLSFFSGKLALPVLHENEKTNCLGAKSSGRGEGWCMDSEKSKRILEIRLETLYSVVTPQGCDSLLKQTPLFPRVGSLTVVFTR